MPVLVSPVALKVLKATEQLWQWALWFKFLKRKPSHSRKSQPPLTTAKKISKSKLGSTPLVPISNPTIDVGGLKGTEKRHQSRDNLLTTF